VANFTKAAATAKRLVEANGRRVVLVKSNRTPAASAQPWRGSTEQPHESKGGAQTPVIMAFVPATGGGFGKLVADAGGSLAVAFDQVGLLASDSLPTGFSTSDVEEADRVVDGDDVWKVITRGHLKPASKSVLFVLGLKR